VSASVVKKSNKKEITVKGTGVSDDDDTITLMAALENRICYGTEVAAKDRGQDQSVM
jgi:hypothetical protein